MTSAHQTILIIGGRRWSLWGGGFAVWVVPLIFIPFCLSSIALTLLGHHRRQ